MIRGENKEIQERSGYEWTNDINTFESYVFICFWKLSNFWFGDDDSASTLEIILIFVLPFFINYYLLVLKKNKFIGSEGVSKKVVQNSGLKMIIINFY